MLLKCMRLILLSAVAVAPCVVLAQSTEKPKDIVAAKIRGQGYECKKPIRAERDAAESRPNEEVWILECENATYHVRLVPDMEAVVRVMD